MEWRYQTEQENSLKRDVWFLLTDHINADGKRDVQGVFYRGKDDKWLLVDMRGEGHLTLPFPSDKTIVECKDRLVKWLRDKI